MNLSRFEVEWIQGGPNDQHIMVEMLKVKVKEKVLKAARGKKKKRFIIYKKTLIKQQLTSNQKQWKLKYSGLAHSEFIEEKKWSILYTSKVYFKNKSEVAFFKSQLWKQPKCPSTDAWIKKMWYGVVCVCCVSQSCIMQSWKWPPFNFTIF